MESLNPLLSYVTNLNHKYSDRCFRLTMLPLFFQNQVWQKTVMGKVIYAISHQWMLWFTRCWYCCKGNLMGSNNISNSHYSGLNSTPTGENKLFVSSVVHTKTAYTELGTKMKRKIVALLRARSQIPVVGVTGRAPGWPSALKLPGTTV